VNATNAVAGQTIASNIALPTESDIAQILVKAAGAGVDEARDKLLYGTEIRSLNTTPASGTGLTLAGVTASVDWTYSAEKTLTVSKTGGGAFSAADVQAIERALKFQTSASATQGDRTFTFSHVDLAGNTSATAVETVKVDTVAPSAVKLSASLSAGSPETSYFSTTNVSSGKTVVANMPQPTDADIAQVSVTVGGASADPANDQLLFGTVTKTLDTTANSGSNVAISNGGVNVAVNWSYSSAKVLTLSKFGGGSFTASEVQAVEKSLLFKTSAGTTQGGRTFTFAHLDAVGNASTGATETVIVDYTAPVLDLDTTSSASDRAVTGLTSGTTVNSTTFMSTNPATVTDLNGISSVQVRVRGLRDGSSEKLMVGTTEITANGATTSGAVTVGGTSWSWAYSSVNNMFTFNQGAVIATTAQAAALIQNLGYKNTAAGSATDGVRQFFISATDVAGNVGAEVTASMGVNLSAPTLYTPNPLTVFDANNDGQRGDQFVITFVEPVKVDNIIATASSSLANWSVSAGSSLGTNPSISALDAVTLNGTDYATNFLVKTGSSANLTFFQKALTLSGGSTTSTTASYAKMPSVTFGGDFTIEAWVYADGNQTDYARIVDFGANSVQITPPSVQPADNIWLGYNYTTNKLCFVVFSGSTDEGSVVTSNTYINAWHHIAVTVGGTNNLSVTLYVDGVSQATMTLGGAAATVARTSNYIGRSNWSGDGFFKGSIFDLRVYDYARTSTQIASDKSGAIDLTDSNLKLYYSLDDTMASGLVGVNMLTGTNSPTFSSGPAGSVLSIGGANVIDSNGGTANGTQSVTLIKSTPYAGNVQNNTFTGSAGNDFFAGQGGDDTMTGGGGADTFAWQLGEKGSSVITDFKVGDGDMVNLSGLLKNNTDSLGPNSSQTTLSKYLQLTQSGNDAILKVDVDGASQFSGAGLEQTITFTNGWLNGLNGTLTNLVSKKIINLNYQTATPLVLDLNGDGVHTTSVAEGVAFDVWGNGERLKTAWTDGHDGLLVLDRNHDGLINDGQELFGNATHLSSGDRANDGFAALQDFDANGDGVIDNQDAIFSQLQVWVDANLDGVSTATELHTLDELGVTSLHLQPNASTAMDHGNALSLVAHWVGLDGQSHDLVDVNFTTTGLSELERTWLNASQKVDLTTASDGAVYDVRLADVLALPDKTLVITADANDQVNLSDAGWQSAGEVLSLHQHTYTLWHNGDAQLLLDQLAQTHTVL
jgi:hypothetical protein